MRLIPFLLTALLVGCAGEEKTSGETGTEPTLDEDGDGYTAEDGDCDDADASVNPVAAEIWYDGVDQNCDGLDDYDQDQDGSPLDLDCNDEDATVSPDAPEVCDELDNDCDGEVDESGEFTAYLDADGDGFGTGEPLGTYCDLPEGTASNAEDCDDTVAEVNPLAEELCDGTDNDCDGEVDVGATDGLVAYADADADGFGDAGTGTTTCTLEPGWVEDATDCDDTDALTFPGATEVCDLKDNNCDGAVDEGAPEARTYYADADADGYGDPAVTVAECGAPAGYVETGDDCDDADPARSPGATELCDGIDNDCDGDVDADAADGVAVYVDADGDTYGDDATLQLSCDVGAGFVTVGGDCDDTTASASPAETEVCDGLDNNCDGVSDESTAADAPSWYLDADADGYGDSGASAPSCEQPAGFADAEGDCDDADPTVYPDAVELCDELDNDCDGAVDDGADGLAAWYLDGDGDGYGDAVAGVEACEQPAGYVEDAQDCDDTDPTTYPGATETCDGADQDCDGAADDDATDALTFYADADSDGYGDPSAAASACDLSAGYTFDASDCDDTTAAVNPAATEVCNDLDDDCDGAIDPVTSADVSDWYADADADGYGDPDASTAACDAPAGAVADGSDCDDTDAAANPGEAEACDEIDNDCDGSIDEAGAIGESTWYRDADADGYGVSTSTLDACYEPTGYAADAGDCDDGAADSYPGATEILDGVDNDCDGSADEGLVGEGDVIVSEYARQVRVGGSSTNAAAAWFELYNTTTADIDLSDWYITRYVASVGRDGFYVDPADGVVIPAGGYAVFCKTDDYTADVTSASDLLCDYFWGDESAGSSASGTYFDNTFNLQRDEDTLSLYYGGDTSTGTLIDEVHWTYDATGGYWPRDATRSAQLDRTALDSVSNDALDNWCSTTNNVFFEWYYVSSSIREFGTPGLQNHTCP